MSGPTTRGPVFDGRWESQVRQLLADIGDAVGQVTLEAVQRGADQNFKHPTPYYETQITLEVHGLVDRVVHDRGIVYGPWLERGGRGTRFRGYHLWENAAREAQRAAPRIVDQLVEDFVRRVG